MPVNRAKPEPKTVTELIPVMTPITALKPYENNAKLHPPDQIDKIIRSIEMTGFDQPIVINKDGYIIKGHGRLMAAQKMGLKTVPVITLDVTKEVADKARLIDNKSSESGYDLELLIKELQTYQNEIEDTGYSTDDLASLLQQLEAETIIEEGGFDEGSQDDVPDEDEVETRVKPGDIWQLGQHWLLCGDCTVESNIKALIGDRKVDMVFTDPPYGINWNTDYSNFTDGKLTGPRNKFEKIANDNQEFNPDFLLKQFNNCLFFGANCFSNKLPLGSWIVWDKRYENGSAFLADAEVAWYSGSGAVYIIQEVNQGFVHSDEKKYHPTQKPVNLFIKIFDKIKIGKTILDPFLGSGTTIIACEKTGRVCYGTELSAKYCDVILTRWEKLTGKVAVLSRNIGTV